MFFVASCKKWDVPYSFLYAVMYASRFPCLGYAGIYQKRTGVHKDGCAVFYSNARLELLNWSGVKYQNGVQILNRDNVGLVTKFAVRQGGR